MSLPSLPSLCQLPIGVGEHDLAVHIWNLAKQGGPLTHITLILTGQCKFATKDIAQAPYVLQECIRVGIEGGGLESHTLHFDNRMSAHTEIGYGFGLADLLMKNKWPGADIPESALFNDESLFEALAELAMDVVGMGRGNDEGQDYPDLEEVAPIMATQVNYTRRRLTWHNPMTPPLAVEYIGDMDVVHAWAREVYRPIRKFLKEMANEARRAKENEIPQIVGLVRIMWKEDE